MAAILTCLVLVAIQAHLVVSVAPTLTVKGKDDTADVVTMGQNVKLTCSASPPLKFFKNDTEYTTVANVNGQELTIPSFGPTHVGEYKCSANAAPTVFSNVASLKAVQQATIKVVETNNAQVVTAGQQVKLVCETTTSDLTFTYAFYKGGNNQPDVTQAELTIDNFGSKDAAEYTCQASASVNPLTFKSAPSSKLALKVVAKPTIEVSRTGGKDVVTEGQEVKLKCNSETAAENGEKLKYKFYKGNEALNGDSEELTITSFGATNAGDYTCEASIAKTNLPTFKSARSEKLELKAGVKKGTKGGSKSSATHLQISVLLLSLGTLLAKLVG